MLEQFNKLLEQPRFIAVNTSTFQNVTHTITPANLHKRVKLRNQDNFKRIYKNPVISTNNQKLLGSIGVSLNGIEYQSPISKDYISYGQLDELEVLNSGENYDIVNSPTLSITPEASKPIPDGRGTG